MEENDQNPKVVSDETIIGDKPNLQDEKKEEVVVISDNQEKIEPLNTKKEVVPFVIPKKKLTDKFATTLFIIAIIAMVVGYLPLISLLLVAAFQFILILIAFLTLFSLLLNEDFRNLLNNGDFAAKFVNQFLVYTPYVLGGAAVFFVASLVLFCFSNKKANKIVGIILSSLFLIVCVVGAVFVGKIFLQ